MLTIVMLMSLQSVDELIMQRERKKIAAHEKKLIEDPVDAKANTEVGKFWCFVANDWEKGLPMLQICDDEKLSTVAMNEGKQGEELNNAEFWWTYGSKLKGLEQRNVMSHSLEWFAKAWPYIMGKEKAKALARVNAAWKIRGPVEIKVSARDAWKDTGLDLIEGQTFSITATGNWCSNQTVDKSKWTDMKGHAGSKLDGGPCPEAQIMALVSKIDNENAVSVGKGTLKVLKCGRLHIGPNDYTMQDNQGELTVRIEIK